MGRGTLAKKKTEGGERSGEGARQYRHAWIRIVGRAEERRIDALDGRTRSGPGALQRRGSIDATCSTPSFFFPPALEKPGRALVDPSRRGPRPSARAFAQMVSFRAARTRPPSPDRAPHWSVARNAFNLPGASLVLLSLLRQASPPPIGPPSRPPLHTTTAPLPHLSLAHPPPSVSSAARTTTGVVRSSNMSMSGHKTVATRGSAAACASSRLDAAGRNGQGASSGQGESRANRSRTRAWLERGARRAGAPSRLAQHADLKLDSRPDEAVCPRAFLQAANQRARRVGSAARASPARAAGRGRLSPQSNTALPAT